MAQSSAPQSITPIRIFRNRFMAGRTICLLIFASISTGKAEKSLDINFGLSPSKSILGLSYANDMNQINFGLHGFAYQSSDGGYIMPGIAYNRYLTDNGFFATINYSFFYVNQTTRAFVLNNGILEVESSKQKGWGSGMLGAGLGKSFQFTRWGLHADAGLATPATSDFGQAWGVWIGAGVSYRFHLD